MNHHQRQAAKCRTTYKALLLAAAPAGIIIGLRTYWPSPDLVDAALHVLGVQMGILAGVATVGFSVVFHRGSVLFAAVGDNM